MNERVLVLRDAVVKITQMLSGKGIKVTQRGVNAYVKADYRGVPVLVNLPYLPDNATEELCAAIQGFLDHEVAHIMFSDFGTLKKVESASSHSMLNMLEDARIEKVMAQKFSGCGHNLSVTGKFFLDKYTTPMLNEAMASGNVNKVVAVMMVPMIRALSGQHVFKDYISDKMHTIQPVYDLISDLEEKITNATSTEECFGLAQEIEKRLRSDKKGGGDSKDEGGGEGDDSGEAKSSDDKKGKGKSKSGGKSKKNEKPSGSDDEESEKGGKKTGADEKEDDKEEDEEDESASDKGEKEKDKSESDADADAEGKDEKSDGAGSGEDEGGENSDSDGEGDSGDGEPSVELETGGASAIWEEIDKENANGFDKTMSVMISDAATDAARGAEYLVYTKDADRVESFKAGIDYRPEMLKQLTEQVEHMVGPLQKDLERAIAARSLSVWENGRRSGCLAPANLSRLAVGDSRVFRRKHESTSKDVAVSLVVDASGSMAGQKIHLAAQSAYALSSVLERIGIKHEVICFTTGEPCADSSAIESEVKKIGRGFTRTESLYMPILKGFNERLSTETKERFGWLPNSRILRNNVDGECIEIAARRLMARREAGKVMIVLSDGAPNAYGDVHALSKHLKKAVKQIASQGVNVVGLGIMTDTVRNYYPKNVVINNVSELPDRVIKELRHLLVH